MNSYNYKHFSVLSDLFSLKNNKSRKDAKFVQRVDTYFFLSKNKVFQFYQKYKDVVFLIKKQI